MGSFRLAVGLALVAMPSFAACGVDDESPGDENGSEAPAPAIRIQDDAGREVTLSEPPERIVSLVPSATETLVALGAGDRLVARTDYDTLPRLRSLPSVGGGLHPNLERLVALGPDLVIRFAGPSDRSTPSRLTELGIPHLAVRPDGIEDVRRIVRMMGQVARVPNRADSLVAEMDSTLSRIAGRVGSRPPRRVAFVLGGSPPWVAGPGTFVDELIHLAGGRNAFSDLGDLYGPVSREAFVARDIDLVLTTRRGELDFVPSDIPVRRVPAGVETPGLDLGESARILARILHPDAFPTDSVSSEAPPPEASTRTSAR
ncbi:MAG: ABC transporter substrate-binding protein [Longimicrobiales bacterium]|nr:ABC transporter substrate-binding protein [Longimicrobiales bacterium]